MLERFNLHQRFQHWLLAVAFITLVLTGFPMKFADHEWAAWLVNLFGGLTWGRWFQSISGLSWARWLHRISGVILILAMLYHCIYIARSYFKQKTTSGKGWIKSIFDLPMMITPTDLKQMSQLVAYLLFLRRERPQFDRFNLEEKFEYIGVFWGTILLGTTGALMWANAWTTQYFPGRLLTIATLVHSMEAFLALLHVGVVHMVSVIFAPGVFPISPAMFTGRTPTEEIAEAHSAMIESAEKALELSAVEEVSHG
jgi:formate dehydrogenase gamma subunit